MKVKRILSAKAIRSIKKAQKLRWKKFHAAQKAAKQGTNGNRVEHTSTQRKDFRTDAFKFLNERSKLYNSPMEAYIDGFLDGRDAK